MRLAAREHRRMRGPIDRRALAVNRWNGPAVDDVLGAVNACGAVRGQVGDEVGDLVRVSGTPDRDPTEAVEDNWRASSIVPPLSACSRSKKSTDPSVRIQPGDTTLTRTPLGPSSLEMDLL